MKQNIDKFLSKTITTYTFLLVIIFILKLVGFDYFGLSLDNKTMIELNNILEKNRILNNLLFFIPLVFAQFVVLSVTCNDNSKRMIKYNIVLIPIYYVLEGCKIPLFGNFAFILEILYFYIVCLIYNKNVNIKKYAKVMMLITFIQIMSYMTRYNYSVEYITNRVASMLLSLDYIIMLIIIYKFNFMKGDEKSCGYQDHQFYSLDHLTSLKKQLKRHQTKSLSKKEKFEYYSMLILYILWNLFTLVIILFIGFINDTIIECIFIISSFLVSKTTFGKPFHFSSMSTCFIVSNLTYYILNRITTSLGISIIIPIMLGIGLSYVTSRFVKETTIKLYRGMPCNEFNDSILKVTDKDSLQYKICYMFYIERKSELEIAHNVGYSIDNIKKIKAKINKKIKELN